MTEPSLLLDDQVLAANKNVGVAPSNSNRRISNQESLLAVGTMRVLCSTESPRERMGLKDVVVVVELCAIRRNYLDCYNTIHDDGFLQEECGTQQRQRCSRLPRMGRGSTLMEVNEFDSIRLRFIE
ncbi:hypothetical protein SCA6_010368 [Theobroma cacao]